MTLIITVVSFIVALGCLIVIHEFGHYLVARLCHVKVLRFSVGFGKPLWRKSMGRDGTEWVVAAFPLGGYVKMLDEREGEVRPEDLPRAFNRQPVSRRIAIVAAGPIANFLLAIALYWVLFMSGIPGIKPVIGPVAPNSPAASAGFVPGETMVRIGSEAVKTWQDARWMLLQHAVDKSTVTIEVRSGKGDIAWRKLDLSGLTANDLDGDFLATVGLARFQLLIKPVIGSLVDGGAAQRAGLRIDDEIVMIDNEPIEQWGQLVAKVRDSPDRVLNFGVRRNGAGISPISITPGAITEKGRSIGRIGAAPRIDPGLTAGLVTEVRYGPLDSMMKALYKTWDTSIFSLRMLGKMIVGQVSLKNLSGPITIADYAGQSAQSGWISYVFFLALISISLGVLNLLPIPLLDGGHLMYYMLEIFKGSPVSDKAMEIGQHIGMLLLFTLMVFALYNDINRLISG